jgi:two-component system, cell cycle response regulator
MTARVLVVDDIVANVRLLEAKLSAEYFDVVTAMNGLDALEAIQRTKPDIVLLDVMMPGIDGIEVCKRIKSNAATQHIPVVMVTALDQPEDRVRGLEAGADDFLTKPVNDISLFCRIKSLVRLKMLTDELRMRSSSGDGVGLIVRAFGQEVSESGKILLVDGRQSSADRLNQVLGQKNELAWFDSPQKLLESHADYLSKYDLIIVSIDEEKFDALRLCSQLKSLEATRQTPILIIVDPDDQQRLLKALDMGVNDYLMRPVDRQELQARVTTQIRRHRYTEQLRSNVRASIELAVTDALTGLYNRRYLETHLSYLIEHSINRGKTLSIVTFDVDHFKVINDTFGHDAGDRVLKELADTARSMTRGLDISCRIGGEEFVIVLPNADSATAERVAERLRRAVAEKKFDAQGDRSIDVTISAGIATLVASDDSLLKIMKRADLALYQAKRDGRNRVVLSAAA